MNLDRMYRIAETGDVNDPTPVDNVLRMVEAAARQKQQNRPKSASGRFKNFADSNAGRTLWGGFGAGLGVALAGGDFKNALGYGVIGAGNTVGILNQNRQYANRLALKQKERCPTITYAPQDKFIDFVDSLREDYPEYRLRCVDNHGIRERIEKQVKADRIILENNRQKAK